MPSTILRIAPPQGLQRRSDGVDDSLGKGLFAQHIVYTFTSLKVHVVWADEPRPSGVTAERPRDGAMRALRLRMHPAAAHLQTAGLILRRSSDEQ